MVTDRKELKENVLAQKLGQAYQGIKQGPSRGTVIFVSLVVLAVIVYFVYNWFSERSAASSSERWLKLDGVLFQSQIDSLLDDSDFKDTPQYRPAQFKQARTLMTLGLQELGSDSKTQREEARKNVEQATQLYEELAKSAGRVPLLHQEALWGAARGHETLGTREDMDRAREYYQRLTKEYEKSALGKEAAIQLKRLDDEDTKRELRELNSELGTK
jgi:hypothetical protein